MGVYTSLAQSQLVFHFNFIYFLPYYMPFVKHFTIYIYIYIYNIYRTQFNLDTDPIDGKSTYHEDYQCITNFLMLQIPYAMHYIFYCKCTLSRFCKLQQITQL
jgi:hypothetical protein